MNCHEAGAYLSPYYDRQLTGERRQAVAVHIRACQSCRHELETFASLSKLTQSSFAEVSELDLLNLQAPETLWSRIEGSLPEASKAALQAVVSAEVSQSEVGHIEVEYPSKRFLWPLIGARWEGAALATLLLIAMGAGIFWFQGGVKHPHELQGRLAHYINNFTHDADAAQRALVADYGAQRVNLQEASRRLGYLPVIPNRLPKEYSLEAIYVFEMDCCNCAQYVCHRGETGRLTIFEHGDAHAADLANWPTEETHCNGQCCLFARRNGALVASWQVGPRQITVVGARDIQEVHQLMRHFGKNDQGAS